MKDGAMLLNTARGPLVEENALAEALKCGKLRGAAMDVANVEPIPMDSPLLSAPNCVLTPHQILPRQMGGNGSVSGGGDHLPQGFFS